MAQQIALRIHCDRRGVSTVAFHPTCHLELHKHGAYAHLHGLKAELVGGRDRLIELEDLEALHAPIGALLIELPQREIGGRLPEWEDLVRQIECAVAAPRRISTAPGSGSRHLTTTVFTRRSRPSLTPCTSRSTRDSAALRAACSRDRRSLSPKRGFGDADTAAPSPACFRSAAAQRGLDVLVPQMPQFLAHARALAAALREVPGITTVPDPPQTPLFHLHLRGDRDALLERALALAQEQRVWLFNRLEPSVVPDINKLELNIGEPALAISPQEAAELFTTVTAA